MNCAELCAEEARLALEQEEAIKVARAHDSLVIMFIGEDKKKHYKASCNLTQKELELIKKQEGNHDTH